LSEVGRKVIMDDEFPHHTLFVCVSIASGCKEETPYSLGLEMGASQAMVVLVKVHHLESIELI
jgi:hypothetical protein